MSQSVGVNGPAGHSSGNLRCIIPGAVGTLDLEVVHLNTAA
jgi:hypothetical protein